MRSIRVMVREFITLAAIGALAGCSDRSITRIEPPPADFPFLLSESRTGVGAAAGAAAGSHASDAGTVYVALPPGTVPTGRVARVRNVTTRVTAVAVDLVDGGFDPVPLAASAGDTIEIVVSLEGGGAVHSRAAVPARRPPVIVRTVPPRGGTDVPLNTRVMVVFSEPMDPATITTGTVRLLRGSAAVAGQVTLSADGLRAEFVPDGLLGVAAEYMLRVELGVRDGGSEALEAAYSASFVTESGTALVARVLVEPAALTLAPAESVLVRARVLDSTGAEIARTVAWTTSDSTVAAVHGDGWVVARALGTATVTAAAEGKSGAATVSVGRLVFASISAGAYHTCGVTTDGSAYCWGDATDGQLGNGLMTRFDGTDPVITPVPVPVAGGLRFASLSAGLEHTCGITTDSAAYCWGYNPYGELGNGSTTSSAVPVAVAGGLRFRSVSVGTSWGWSHTCGLTTAGSAYCWGQGGLGQLGNGRASWVDSAYYYGSATPIAVSGGLTFRSLSAGYLGVCAIASDGRTYCWGSDMLVLGSAGLRSCTWIPGDVWTWGCSATPVAVFPGWIFDDLSAGYDWACGLRAGGAAYCWNANWHEAPGVPRLVSGGHAFAQLDVGWNGQLTCGVTTAGAAYCWGSIPDGGGTYTLVPQAVPGGVAFRSVSVGASHACGLTAAGAVYCWGSNGVGQLGQPAAGDFSAAPVKVAGQP